ncbi:putative lipoprotein [Shewanella halifaxensis HAW-EB4]|uniref:Lipoprotein n=1 Tax=Shewanella halifaxensis (strain HAW-EB4) TaxID=458817 RepID=B0TQR9_SHEHH|nr:lipoprotein [Shewanella halifaxensis]ABZ76314.1 putative lipoprotein [Shewanella halifaxensis HAW-EB4]
MKKILMAFFITTSVTVFTGCASAPKNFTLDTFSGSRSDGVIEMGYLGGYGWVKNVNWAATGELASQRCRSWGYEDAERFGLGHAICIEDNGAGGAFKMCTTAKYTVEYQCTGKMIID